MKTQIILSFLCFPLIPPPIRANLPISFQDYNCIIFVYKILGSEIIRAFLVKRLESCCNLKCQRWLQTINRSIATVERFNQGFYLYLQLLSLMIQTNITSMVTGLLTRQEDIT